MKSPILVRKLKQSIARDGWFGPLKAAGRKAKFVVHSISPSARRSRILERSFDDEYGVSTGGRQSLSTLSVKSENVEMGNGYQATSPEMFRKMIECIHADLSPYTFVDLGSGKGRTLILASDFPFKSIVGVEFAKELHETAVKNLTTLSDSDQKYERVTLIHGDATEFEIPMREAVLYLYNPFEEPVMRLFATNLRNSLDLARRQTFVIYHNARFPQCFDEIPHLTRIAVNDEFVVWSSTNSLSPVQQS